MSGLLALLVAGQVFVPDAGDVSVKEARKLVRDYAHCLVKKRAAEASAAVLSSSDNSALIKDHPRLIDGNCLTANTGRMAFAGDLYRYALADALVARELPATPLDPAAIAPLAHRVPEMPSPTKPNGKPLRKKIYQEKLRNYGVALAYAQVTRFGECVVRANPAGARRLLASDMTSAAEASAMAALATPMGHCLPEGQTLHLTKEVLRGTVALNYYRLAKASQGTGIKP